MKSFILIFSLAILLLTACKIKHTCTCTTTNKVEFINPSGQNSAPTAIDSTKNTTVYFGSKKKGMEGCVKGGSIIKSESYEGNIKKVLTKVINCRFK
jgi:hypothetical protein